MSSGEYGQGEQGPAEGAGRLLAGRYRVVAQLGRGGMGVVWRAVDEVLGREVAVKELRTYNDADGPELDGLRLRMQREARAAARVRHPGVVAVHDVAEVDGRPLIVMELVDGPSLDDILRERTLDPREAAGVGAKVMDALAAAHAAGVLHRDVKPGNILLERSGRVVLTDFGIATMEDPGDGSATHLTRSGELVGSLDYLAPERAQGADPGPASDIWALGATLYAAVEGSAPFRRTSTFSTLTAIVTEPLPEPHHAGHLAPVLRRLLDKRPEARPEAEDARELLQAVADTAGTDTPTTTLRGPTAPLGFGPPEPAGQGLGTPGQGTPEAEGFDGAGQGASAAPGLHVPGEGASVAPGSHAPGQGTPERGGPGSHGFGATGQVGHTGEAAGTGEAGQPGHAGGTGRAEQAAETRGIGGTGRPGPGGMGQPGDTGQAEQAVQIRGIGGTGQPGGTGQAEQAAQTRSIGGTGRPGHAVGTGQPGQSGGTGQAEQTAQPRSTGQPGQPASPPQGFGASAPTTAHVQAHHDQGGASGRPSRRKGRALLAAVAVTVVLGAAGGTVALLNDSGEAEADGRPSSPTTSASASASASDRTDADRSEDLKPTEQGDEKAPSATSSPSRKTEPRPTGEASSSAPANSSVGGTGGGTDGGTSGGSDDGGTPGGGGGGGAGETTPAPSCESIGAGKYNCQVWRTAKSYTASGTEVGVLNAGTNYFYCQQNLGRRETYGEWTNVWWAKTDDDSGNTNVYVSDVYVRGGDNDAPVPGLPVC
ncbi:protein kinase [Streptomyces sp. NPDC050619]|uniref:serine/threonine-protein kinase n=1 Tax=Streptomyces sp. NPDC050619 TaxID=3157214 RepID=UPI0034215AC0